MKALLVTSRVTFVPQNYGGLVTALAAHPHVGGLLVLGNLTAGLWLRALFLAVSPFAPRTGRMLLANAFRSLADPRVRAFRQAGKPVFRLRSVNTPKMRGIVRDHGFDLVVNARTRDIYAPETLAAPRLGCWNIHHGLLPDQRGVLCDLWAMAEGQTPGFTVHRMAAKVDGGAILLRCPTPAEESDFLGHVGRCAQREAVELGNLLVQAAEGTVPETPNRRGAGTRYFRNPTVRAMRRMRKAGILL